MQSMDIVHKLLMINDKAMCFVYMLSMKLAETHVKHGNFNACAQNTAKPNCKVLIIHVNAQYETI